MSKSYVERSLEWLREQRFTYSVASGYNNFTRQRWDLLGVFDYVGFQTADGYINLHGIQICGKDYAPHVKKINNSELAKLWVLSGNEILLIGWRELKKTGWTPRITRWQGRGDFQPSQSNQLISMVKKPPDISLL